MSNVLENSSFRTFGAFFVRLALSRSGLIAAGLFCVGALGAAGVIVAAPSDPAPPAPVSPAPPPPPLADDKLAGITLAPHRATYVMKLVAVKNGSPISDAAGHLTFELRDACDGWIVQQNLKMRFSYIDDDDQDTESNEVSWEAKDGSAYKFNIRRTTNDEEVESYHGKATRNTDGTFAVAYVSPAGKTAELPADTLFPSRHTALVLSRAGTEDRFFSRRVFDGADEEGSGDISAFILPRKQDADATGTTPKLKGSPLLKEAAWPVHMAFFSQNSETGEPDHEMDIKLHANGVASHLQLDYGDFSIAGTLEEVKAIPAPNCP